MASMGTAGMPLLLLSAASEAAVALEQATASGPLQQLPWEVRKCLLELRTRAGHAVLDAPPQERWQLLAKADWQPFFNRAGKSFVEVRWWWRSWGGLGRAYTVCDLSVRPARPSGRARVRRRPGADAGARVREW